MIRYINKYNVHMCILKIVITDVIIYNNFTKRKHYADFQNKANMHCTCRWWLIFDFMNVSMKQIVKDSLS